MDDIGTEATVEEEINAQQDGKFRFQASVIRPFHTFSNSQSARLDVTHGNY